MFKTKLFFLLKRLNLNTFLKIIFIKSTSLFLRNFTNVYYSQTGEDNILSYIFRGKSDGYYIDVGCNHPIRMSNTFRLYLKGWNGICIDANKKYLQLFKRVRKLDIVLNLVVSNDTKAVKFYEFTSDAVSTIDHEHMIRWSKNSQIRREIIMYPKTLNEILDQNLGKVKAFDLLCIDVEGHDLNVLKSLNFNIYKPKVIIIEAYSDSLIHFMQEDIYLFLTSVNYELLYFATMNAYFRLKDSD